MTLIDRDELLKYPIRRNHCDKKNANQHFIDGVESVMEYAEQLPVIEAETIVHGHWKRALPFYYDCSVCGHNLMELLGEFSELYYDICSVAKYCPFCGAKMDEVSE